MQQNVKAAEVSDVPKMVQLVMKWFGFKEQKQAEYVLLGFVVVAIGVSLYLFFGGSIGNSATKNPGLDMLKNAPQEMFPIK